MSFAIMDNRPHKPHTLYAYCLTLESARRWIDNVNVNLFIDKTVTKECFQIVERKTGEAVT